MERFGRRVRSVAAALCAAAALALVPGAPAQAATAPVLASPAAHALTGTAPTRTLQPMVAGTQVFSDVPASSQFSTEISWLSSMGVTTGWDQADGSRLYRPLQSVNRDAMAAFMYRLAGSPAFTPPAASPFADVAPSTQFYKEITWLSGQGISTGWTEADGTKTYRPLQSVNRDAMAAFMYRYAGSPAFAPPAGSPFADTPATGQFYKEITWLAGQGISTGWTEADGTKTYRPLQSVNRDAMAAFMYRFYRTTHPLAITDGTFHEGTAGARYLEQLNATGGIAPLTWSATGLPPGLTMTGDGTITGIPTTTATSTVTATVTDAAGSTATATRTLSVPTALPASCIAKACAVLTPTAKTLQVPATAITSITRDPATAKVASATLSSATVNGTPVATGQILVLAPTAQIESGAIGTVTALTPNPDGTVTAALAPGTLSDAYTAGTINSIDPTAPTAASPNTALPPNIASPNMVKPEFTCDPGVIGKQAGISLIPSLVPAMTTTWKNPLAGQGTGIDLFQFDLTGTIKLNLGASISGEGKCTLTIPELKTTVPAGEAGVVVLAAAPSITLDLSAQAALSSSVTFACNAEYRSQHGTETRTSHCSTENDPLSLDSATGITAKATGAIDVRAALDDIVGVTGQLSADIDTNYTPAAHPVATVDASAGYELGACLLCFWAGSPAKITLFTGTFFDKRIATYDTPLPPAPTAPAPLTLTSDTPTGTAGQAYRATLTAAGGTAPYRFTLTPGTALPPGLTLDPASGTITGIPTAAGSYPLGVGVADASGPKLVFATAIDVQPSLIPGFTSITPAAGRTFGIRDDGTAWAWGYNNDGGLGIGSTTSESTPTRITGLASVRSITALSFWGSYYAVEADGSVWAWGHNDNGQLGNGTTTDSAIPLRVHNLDSVTAIAGNGQTVYALKSDGTVWAWGAEPFGSLGNGTLVSSSLPLQVPGLTGVASIVAGGEDTGTGSTAAYALKKDGTLWAWGDNTWGELGNGQHSDSSTPVEVQGLSDITSVTAAYGFGQYVLALKADGTLWAWGNNNYGYFGTGNTTSSPVPVPVTTLDHVRSAYALHGSAFALKDDGTLWSWGDNTDGRLGNGTTASTALLPTQVKVPGTVRGVSIDEYAASALDSSGTVWSWGDNTDGRLGNGTTAASSATPVQATGLTAIQSIASSDSDVYALATDGTLWAWGANYNSQLGTEISGPSSIPMKIPTPTN